ncbi:hypothetical protein CEP51_015469 [Fusarium floridanum]|uniref:Glutamine amidotransferase domain-containing protein n=1 Tax=Fusarium floridanum TaxID=1325733 RepID=A0A428P955_9HYPO|nr:hypothetical protein CEP51_015469 [Fusarium floridanum]
MAADDQKSIKKVPSVDGPAIELKDSEKGHSKLHIDRRQLLRKIDLRLMPAMIISYMLQYLDKTTLGYAAVTGIREDTNLSGQDYAWASSMFYFGYMAASYPMSFGFAKFPISRFLGVTMVVWGIVLCCHAAASSFASLMVLRFLLGASESAISPGFSLLTGMWYAPQEHASRHAIWFAGNAVATMFGSLLAYGIGHAQSGIASWRLIFIIFGAITLAWSLVILFFLPDDPSTAKFLTQEERTFAVNRAQKAQATSKTGQYEWPQLWEALIDPKTWLLFLYADRSRYGGYGGLTATWLKSNDRLREQTEIRVWDTKNKMEYPKPDEYDVILITGAPTHPMSQDSWVKKLLPFMKKTVESEPDKKFVGICFGHQVMALAHGLSVGVNDKGYENAVTSIQLSEMGKRIFKQDTIALNQSHCWEVKEGDLGKIQNVGSTANTAIQGLYLPGRLWTLQSHPEFDKKAMERVLELTRPEISEEEYLKAVADNTGKVDQQVALESLADFVLS